MPFSSSDFSGFYADDINWNGDAGPYVEPQHPHEDNSWASAGVVVQAFQEGELPCNCGTDWLGEYESYFVGGWGKDLILDGYEDGIGSPSDSYEPDEREDDRYYNYDGAELQPAFDYDNPWSSSGFGIICGVEEGRNAYGFQEPESSNVNGLDQTKLWEMIFGPWPSFLGPDQETCSED